MGQCYTVYLKVKFNDEEGAKNAIHARLREQDVNISELGKSEGLDLDTMDGLLRHYYSNWEYGHKWTTVVDPDVLCGDFNATYSWESVMMEVFDLMAPFLQDGSEIKIYPDSGLDKAIVRDGKAVWVA